MSEFRVVEANGQPYPPHAQPCRTLDAALRRRDYYQSIASVSGEARMPVKPLRIERRSMVVSMWEPWNVGALAAADREKPDERLSSVRGETFYHAVCLGCEESPDEDGAEWRATAHEAAEVAAEHGWRDGRCEECQPVADREKPEACRAPHCFSEYGTPCGTCPAATPDPPDDEGWSPGIDDPEPPALGDIDTGEGWYQT